MKALELESIELKGLNEYQAAIRARLDLLENFMTEISDSIRHTSSDYLTPLAAIRLGEINGKIKPIRDLCFELEHFFGELNRLYTQAIKKLQEQDET
jgi:hypothetical protein